MLFQGLDLQGLNKIKFPFESILLIIRTDLGAFCGKSYEFLDLSLERKVFY